MTTLSRRSVLAGAAAAALAPKMSFAQSTTDVRFAVDWTWQGNHSVWTLAADKGLLADEKLAVNIDRGYGSSDNLTKLAAGALDIALVDPNLLAKFNQQNPGKQMTSVCVFYDNAPSAAIFLKSSGIETLKDIEGRKVAISDGDASVPLFKALCTLNGVDLDKIEFLSVQPALRDTMVIQKRADLSLGFFTTSVLNIANAGIPRDEIDFFQFAKHGLALYSLSLVCTKDYAAANPDTVAAFVRGTIAGTKAMLAEPEAAIASVKKRDGLIKEEVELERNQLFTDSCLLTPWVRENGLSTIERARFESTTGQVAELMGVARPKMEDIYTEAHLPPKAERMLV